MKKINKWLSIIIFIIAVINFVRLIYVCTIKDVDWIWGITMIVNVVLGLWCLKDISKSR